MIIKTASWYTELPADHIRIGISRGVPRRQAAGYRLIRDLTPGPWFSSVDVMEYRRRYQQILDQLDPAAIVAKINELAGARVAVMVCFEKPDGASWCHRALVAQWLHDRLGVTVPELGFEHLPQEEHPLMPKNLRAAFQRPESPRRQQSCHQEKSSQSSADDARGGDRRGQDA